MAAHQASLSLGFSRQEYWSGLPFPCPMHESEVAQSCLTLSNPMDYSLPGSSVQARVLEWGAIGFSARPPCPSPTPWVYPNSCPLSWWCYPTISFSVIPFSSHLQSFPASGSFPTSQFFTSGAKVWEFQLQHQSFQWTLRTDLLQDRLVGSPWSPRDFQKSSLTPQFKSINSMMLSLPYSPTHIHTCQLEKP